MAARLLPRPHDVQSAPSASALGSARKTRLGIGSRDAYAMAGAIRNAGVIFQTGYFMRGMPNVLTLKRLVEEGFFGQITRVRASNCGRTSKSELPTLWLRP